MSRRTSTLHIFALSALAIAQPLLDLLGRSGEFFVASRSGPLELLLLVAMAVVGVPALLVLVEEAAGLLGACARHGAHTAIVGGLLAIAAMPILDRVLDGPGGLVAVLAALAGAAGAVAYRRLEPVRLLFTFLSIAVVIVPANFLLNSDATKILFQGTALQVGGPPVEVDTPVVLLVFDELPLASLLNQELKIDAARYPNFARLASTASWFRNATSVSDGTAYAVPAILTGRYAEDGLLATAADHPENLFTLLKGSYRIEAREPVTRLCPERLCGDASDGSDLRTFLGDSAVVLGHAILPAGLAERLLPSVDRNWRGFVPGSGTTPSQGASRHPSGEVGFEGLDVEVTAERRVLYALHLMLPHLPWRYLPDGHQYGRARDIPGLAAEEHWTSNEAAVVHAYQRHLLQVAYADRVLGDLMGRLEQAGIYDESLVIVVSDHGSSFHPGDSRRHLTVTNWSDLLRVPLLVKFPGQRRGAISDDPVQTVDILPTIADVLGIELPFPVDGRSLQDDRAPVDASRAALGYKFGPFTPPADLSGLPEAVGRKTTLFGAGADTRKLFGPLGPWELVGERLDGRPVAHPADLSVVLSEPERFEHVRPETGFVPALVSGVVSGAGLAAADTFAAIAINGTIRAVAPLVRFGQEARFRTMVPGVSFGPGRNEVAVLLGGRSPARLRRARVADGGYGLRTDSGVERLEGPSGRAIPIEPDAVRGVVDAWSRTDLPDYLSIWGWAADMTGAGLPSILVFADDRYVASTGPVADRPDVARALENDDFLRSGFVVRVPWTEELLTAESIRLFGISARGLASELTYGDFPYRPGAERLSVPGMPRAVIEPRAVRGYVDLWAPAASNDAQRIAGWVADPAHSAPPKVVVLADDRIVATIAPTIERPDVARVLSNDAVLLSGYSARIPLSALEHAQEIRVFGVSGRGVASELSYPPGFPVRPAPTPSQ